MLREIGYDVHRIEKNNKVSAYSPIELKYGPVVDLDYVAIIGISLPGMTTKQSGQNLFSLSYFQQEKGDVVEIGTWQGRSASFLARATYESGNGEFFAIDHFQGSSSKNGKKNFVVNEEDLSDLVNVFNGNMARIGLSDSVTLLNMTSKQAAEKLSDREIRFIFIDGDHSREGVEKDIELFFPMLVDGAIVMFDDFSMRHRGLVEVLDNFLMQNKHSRVMTFGNTLVLKYKL